MSDGVELVEDLVDHVGAHKGEDTAFYLAKGYRVVALEANGELIRTASGASQPRSAKGD